MRRILGRFRRVAWALVLLASLSTAARAGSITDFESFVLGTVNGQGGWSASNSSFDQEVVDLSGNQVWRVSNAVTAGSFGDMPYAPRPGGTSIDTVNNPVNSLPDEFAGESSTGATHNRYFTQFDFKSATGAAQNGLSITVSPDNGTGGRQGFVDIEDTGTSLQIISYDVDSSGNFVGPFTIAPSLSYTDWHTIGIEILFNEGADNDVVNYYVNDSLVYSGTSWEQYYPAYQPALNPLGVPVQTTLFRISGTAALGTLGGGFYLDNVLTEVSTVPEPSSLVLLGMGMVGLAGYGWRRRKQRVA